MVPGRARCRSLFRWDNEPIGRFDWSHRPRSWVGLHPNPIRFANFQHVDSTEPTYSYPRFYGIDVLGLSRRAAEGLVDRVHGSRVRKSALLAASLRLVTLSPPHHPQDIDVVIAGQLFDGSLLRILLPAFRAVCFYAPVPCQIATKWYLWQCSCSSSFVTTFLSVAAWRADTLPPPFPRTSQAHAARAGISSVVDAVDLGSSGKAVPSARNRTTR